MNSQQCLSTSTANVPSFDDLFDIPASLRIPPLQTPLPSALHTSTRPSPLEPDARLNMDNEARRLTSRQKALAQAEMLEAPKPGELEALTSSKASEAHPRPNPRRPKTKLFNHQQINDFVHLPKPRTKIEQPKRLRFRPIAALNKLHEPPPSAALFPPITPKTGPEELSGLPVGERMSSSNSARQDPEENKLVERGIDPARPRRTYTRGRTRWTEVETEQLVKGVAIYGMGRWKDILEHRDFTFQIGRTYVDLKDKFRTLFPPNAPHRWARKLPQKEDYSDGMLEPPDSESQKHNRRFPQRARKRAWAEKEDHELEKGFRAYGFQWNLIAKDENLHFNDRTSSQIRDRFRLRFPELYKQSNPTVSDERAPKADVRVASKKRREKSSGTKVKTGPKSPKQLHHEHHDDGQHKIGAKNGASNSLSGLHNDRDGEGKPSSDFSHYDWDNNLTLAPLWEDMVPPPMFDLG